MNLRYVRNDKSVRGVNESKVLYESIFNPIRILSKGISEEEIK